MSASVLRNVFWLFMLCCSCNAGKNNGDTASFYDTAVGNTHIPDVVTEVPARPRLITHTNTSRDSIVAFARSLIGTPYKYGSIDPAAGFDCSGFITYVFNHFDIKVPRSSIDFTNVGREIRQAEAKRGDLILFTGTDSTERFVGHMGIVTSNTDTLRFIHSSSGKVYGVTETPLNKYYQGRFIKVIDIF